MSLQSCYFIDPDSLRTTYESAYDIIFFAKLVADEVFCGSFSLKNPCDADKNIRIPRGCNKKDLPKRLQFPSLYGKWFVDLTVFITRQSL